MGLFQILSTNFYRLQRKGSRIFMVLFLKEDRKYNSMLHDGTDTRKNQ